MYLQHDDLDGKKKRIGKASENKELNELTMNKIRELGSKAVCITKTMIINIGKDIQQNILLDNTCQFSNNWFSCFRNLYTLNKRKMVGEVYSNDFPAALEFTEYFKDKYNHFDIYDIYNADETGFFVLKSRRISPTK